MITPFDNRAHAGRVLATVLSRYRNAGDVLVLALPRGGVPVAAEVARSLHAPLDVLVVRKLGLPGCEETAFGAITAGGVLVLDPVAFHLSPAIIRLEARRERQEAERRERLYRAGCPALDCRDRTVIVVDDGLATGATMRAAIRALRQLRAGRIVVAVPVAESEACRRLRPETDELVVVETPEPFDAVSLWYYDFPQVSDGEVQALLAAAALPEMAVAS